MITRKEFLWSPRPDPDPGFAKSNPALPQENPGDESDILTDQDQTFPNTPSQEQDDKMGAITQNLNTLEDEPGDFMRGEIDVKEQMDRAADALDVSIHGYERQADEDSPRGDLGASFQATPGGLEEVEQKTEEYLAQHRRPKSSSKPPPKPSNPS